MIINIYKLSPPSVQVNTAATGTTPEQVKAGNTAGAGQSRERGDPLSTVGLSSPTYNRPSPGTARTVYTESQDAN